MIKKTIYETSDGKQFECEKKAKIHQSEIDNEPVRYLFKINLTQTFTSPYEVEEEDSPEGMARAKQEVIKAFKKFGQVKIRSGWDWDCWEPEGDLKIIDVEFVEFI